MLLENSNTANSNHNHSSPPHHKKGVMSSLFGHNHHHHHNNHHHKSSKALTHSLSLLPSPSVVAAEEKIDGVEGIITKWDPNSSTYTKITSLFQHSRKEAHEFVAAVKELRQAMNCLMSENSASAKLVLAQKLMQMAMKRLENEFSTVLSENRAQLDPESISGRSTLSASSGSSNHENDAEEEEITEGELTENDKLVNVSEVVMSDLKSIADCMIVCGYGRECLKIYKKIRTKIMEEGMVGLKIERYRSSHISKLGWEGLSGAIKTWLCAVVVAVKTVFKGEKILCDHVFSTPDQAMLRETCFHDVTSVAAANLFRFPELVVTVGKGNGSKKASPPEKIFRLMELYETFSDLWPEIEGIFSPEASADVRAQALTSSLKVRDSIYGMLPDFEASIHKDHSPLVPGGGTHSLTQTVMDHISALADHRAVLGGILSDYPPPENLHKKEYSLHRFSISPANSPGAEDPVTVHLSWLILVLLCKLDSKAEGYKDASLSYLFLANNLQFVVERVKSGGLSVVLGEEWVAAHSKKVQQYAASYESMAWAKVFFSLPDNSTSTTPPRTPPSAAEVAEVFKGFGEAFEEEWRKQAAWIVQDRRLRDELKVSIAKKLVPKYKEFYEANIGIMRGSGSGSGGSMAEVRFTPDDLANYLSDLFHGSSPSGSLKQSLSLFPQRCLSH